MQQRIPESWDESGSAHGILSVGKALQGLRVQLLTQQCPPASANPLKPTLIPVPLELEETQCCEKMEKMQFINIWLLSNFLPPGVESLLPARGKLCGCHPVTRWHWARCSTGFLAAIPNGSRAAGMILLCPNYKGARAESSGCSSAGLGAARSGVVLLVGILGVCRVMLLLLEFWGAVVCKGSPG